MNTVSYIKSFSKGQITIPKEVRDMLGIGDEFWLKLSVDNGRIIAEPMEKKKISKEEYRKSLLSIKGDWFDEGDYRKMRKETEDKLKKLWHE